MLAALDGRGAPKLLARGVDAEGPWLMMEHIPFPSLASRSLSEPNPALVLAFAAPALEALAAIHEASDARGPLEVVHGDVSPDNLLLRRATDMRDSVDDARLVDFGLATFRDGRGIPSSALRGTPRYIAPEVARGEPATAQGDLFSLGLTFLHAASGFPARLGDALPSVIQRAGEESVIPYAEHASRALPAALRDALLAMVAFEPAARPATARQAWRPGSW